MAGESETQYSSRFATSEDIPRLLDIINSAYRPTPNTRIEKMWTDEGHMFSGPRTDEKELREIIASSDKYQLVLVDGLNQVLGTIKVELESQFAAIGMFAVSPLRQGEGIGKQLLIAAECFAKSKNVQYTEMNVLKARKELVQYYMRRGYVDENIVPSYKISETDKLDDTIDYSFLILRKYL